ncbi:MAG: Gfo/Idh/MocA family oxidoreductase [Pseudomonadota bacterium]
MNKLRVGIAGYGVVGKRRRLFIDQNPYLKTVAVSDITFGKSGKFEDGVSYYTDYHDLYDLDLDVLFVSLPNYIAAEACIIGLESGMHVFCEKPPGRDLKDIENVIEVEKKYPHLKLKYGFNHRYHHSVKEAKDIIDSGELGKITSLNGVYGKSNIVPADRVSGDGWRAERVKAGGGILLDQGIHMLDLIRYFCGEFDDIKSFISSDYWNHDVEDNAYAIMRNDDNQYAIIQSSATRWQHMFRLEITFTEGFLNLSGILSGSKSYGEETLTKGFKSQFEMGNLKKEIINYLDDPSWKDEIDEFAICIINDKLILEGNSEDAYKTMKLVYQIYKADSIWAKKYNL